MRAQPEEGEGPSPPGQGHFCKFGSLGYLFRFERHKKTRQHHKENQQCQPEKARLQDERIVRPISERRPTRSPKRQKKPRLQWPLLEATSYAPSDLLHIRTAQQPLREKDQDNRKNRKGRDIHVFDGKSKPTKCLDKANQKPAKDRSRQ